MELNWDDLFNYLHIPHIITMASFPRTMGKGGIWWNHQSFLWSCQFSWNEWGDSYWWGRQLNNHKEGGQLSLKILFRNKNIWKFFKNLSKTKVLRYLKVMISKFCPVGHLILILIKRILPPHGTIWALQGVSHFSNECSSTVYTKSALDLWGQFFLKMISRIMREFLKAPLLVLHFSYYTLMTFLMMLSVILLSMLMILLSILSVISIWSVATTWIGFWTWIWSTRHGGLG